MAILFRVDTFFLTDSPTISASARRVPLIDQDCEKCSSLQSPKRVFSEPGQWHEKIINLSLRDESLVTGRDFSGSKAGRGWPWWPGYQEMTWWLPETLGPGPRPRLQRSKCLTTKTLTVLPCSHGWIALLVGRKGDMEMVQPFALADHKFRMLQADLTVPFPVWIPFAVAIWHSSCWAWTIELHLGGAKLSLKHGQWKIGISVVMGGYGCILAPFQDGRVEPNHLKEPLSAHNLWQETPHVGWSQHQKRHRKVTRSPHCISHSCIHCYINHELLYNNQ